ncbi:hypothetical protein V6C53_17575 [Desulfocurvibacter africanus]|uniref:hypothetical protein n=1 Tax=Desulfocurvibacter africanus TaxID=873 RepID=UPI002FDA51B1
MKSLLACMILSLVVFPRLTPLQAQQGSQWEFTVAPYIWFAGLEGDLTVGDREVDVDVDFSDILDSLDVAFLGQVEARKDPWGVFLQANYFKLNSDESEARAAGPLGFERQLDVDLETTLWLVEFGGSYTAFAWSGSGFPRHIRGDVLAGGRYWSVENDLEATFTGPLTTRDVEAEQEIDWVDPIVGARVEVQLSDRILLAVRGDIGGFGIGDGSDFTWNLLGLLGYRFASWATLWAGYRTLDVDYDNDAQFDMTMQGPLAGLAFTF